MENKIIINVPLWKNDQLDKLIILITPDKIQPVLNLMGSKPVGFFGVNQYLLKLMCYQLFDEGYDAYDVECRTNVSHGTAFTFYKDYLKEFPKT